MAVSHIPVPINDVRVVTGGSSQNVYSDSALYTFLKNSAEIHPRAVQFFSVTFNGGARIGICYLYENSKDYGWIMCFLFGDKPRAITVNNGVTTLRQWATS